jgi:glycosyltransferase involved in cell wall biosynthesis/peptidoglycan/xylan/chitin deacetylase (PgdA/CDA1 family)
VRAEATPRFSVVIPTYQRRDVVVSSVRALAAQEDAPPFEVVVVVDGSVDGSAEALRAIQPPFPLTVVEQENEGRPSACNRGAAVASGELLLFLDDDMEAHPRLLAEHERSHREGADTVIGHLPLHPASPPGFLATAVSTWAEQRLEALRKRDWRIELGDFVTGQMSVRRDVFLRLGGFDTYFERPYGGEDLDLGRRLAAGGYTLAFNPEAISWQRYVITPRQLLRQWRHFGRGAVLLARKHPDQIDKIFRGWRRGRRLDRFVLRWLRWPLRALALLSLALGIENRFAVRLFFRVRNLEYFKGVRGAGGIPGPHPVRVLCYHSISDLAGGVYEPYGIPPGKFRRQLEMLARRFRFIDAAEFGRYLEGAGVPRRAALLTFDDCYEDLVEVALPMLRELGVPALAFAVSQRIGGTSDWDARIGAPQLPVADAAGLRTLAEARVTIGTHTRTHAKLNRLRGDELSAEIEGSLTDFEPLGVERPTFLAYPYGAHDAEVTEAAAAAGLAGAFTTQPGLARPGQDAYAIPRIEIMRADGWWSFRWKVVTAGRWNRGRRRTSTDRGKRRLRSNAGGATDAQARFVAPAPERRIGPGEAPTISIIMAAYQAADTIGEAVASALAQTAPPLEVIVCDDGSTDDLAAALAPYRDRLVLLRSEHRGAASASNHALHAAVGEFVLRFDSDDFLLPGALEALRELAAARPDLDLLSTDVYFEAAGELVGRFYDENPFPVANQRAAILNRCFVGWPAARRTRLLSVGGFDESLVIGSDWDAWIRMILDGARAGLVREPLLRYRLRPGSLSSDRMQSLQARVALLDKILSRARLTPQERKALAATRRQAHNRALAAAARQALLERRPHARRHALSLAIRRGPSPKTRLLALGAALLPDLGARVLARRRRNLPAGDERAPGREA